MLYQTAPAQAPSIMCMFVAHLSMVFQEPEAVQAPLGVLQQFVEALALANRSWHERHGGCCCGYVVVKTVELSEAGTVAADKLAADTLAVGRIAVGMPAVVDAAVAAHWVACWNSHPSFPRHGP